MTDQTCRCGQPTRDQRYVCEACLDRLTQALNETHWLADELETTITRARGIDYRTLGSGGKATERALPAHMGASEARTHLRAVLVSWVRFCLDEQVRNASRDQTCPPDNLPAIARWLTWRIDGLALHDIAPEAVDEITDAHARCMRIIDRPAERQYLGDCAECGGDLYAVRGAQWARCLTCGNPENADEIRARLLGMFDDQLCTAADIARLSTFLGLRADRDQVRKRVNQWHARKRIVAEPSNEDAPVFRFGIVWRLLAHEDEVKAG